MGFEDADRALVLERALGCALEAPILHEIMRRAEDLLHALEPRGESGKCPFCEYVFTTDDEANVAHNGRCRAWTPFSKLRGALIGHDNGAWDVRP